MTKFQIVDKISQFRPNLKIKITHYHVDRFKQCRQSADSPDSADSADSADKPDDADRAESIDKSDNTNNADNADNADNVDNTDNAIADNADNADNTHNTDTADSADNNSLTDNENRLSKKPFFALGQIRNPCDVLLLRLVESNNLLVLSCSVHSQNTTGSEIWYITNGTS